MNSIMEVFPRGGTNTAYAQYFVGNSCLNMSPPRRHRQRDLEPGCRNNRHVHHAVRGGGRILLRTAGCGGYQEENARDTVEGVLLSDRKQTSRNEGQDSLRDRR